MPHTAIGRHGGASRVRKAYRLGARTAGMIGFGRGRSFDLALAHGSNDLAIAARALGIPEANMHDYEYAVTQHHIGCRLAKRVMFPESVPPERLRRFGVGPDKLFPYPGIKEEYYLFDFEPDPGAMERLSVDTSRVVVVVRPAARRLALPPQVEPAIPESPDQARPGRRGPRDRHAPHPDPAVSSSRRWSCRR